MKRAISYLPLFLLVFCLTTVFPLQSVQALPNNPIVFVTQAPIPSDFGTINATFGNHLASMEVAGRGGDLYIRYPDGTSKNLTASAAYGQSGLQGVNAIQVRDPSVHWDGQKVIFSMVVGAPTQQYQVKTFYWQLYEITSLGISDTPVITKVPNQPESFNNIFPVYGTDDKIIFVSDRPRNGAAHLYPQRDEYESYPTNTGLWSLDPANGTLFQLDHAPSGDFSPILDSFGRVIFTRWDHLQRDQQNRCSQPSFAAVNYSSESENAVALDSDGEVYPEARDECEKELSDNLDLHRFNHFLPWQINEDGQEMETLNHVGRHELVGYLGKSFNDDPNVEEYYGQYSRFSSNEIENLFQISESATQPGIYYGISAPEFGTHASGQIVSIDGDPSTPADQMGITYITHVDTSNIDDTPSVNHIGLSRDPVSLSDGTLIAAHTTSTQADTNLGTTASPQSRYSYRLKSYTLAGGYYSPTTALTSGITKSVSFWNPDTLVTYSNVTMWELQPKEVIARTRPSTRSVSLPTPEQGIFDELGIEVSELQQFLRENSLALVVSRNLTTRDKQDKQQPYNLKVEDSETSTIPDSGKVYTISHMQFFQGDQIRGYAGSSSTTGRRVLAQTMHDVDDNPEDASGPDGSVKIASDGSMAAFVPARRALTYQVTDPEGSGVVRERFWLTFQPGEIRVCGSCHGVNSVDQLNQAPPSNPPEALRVILEHWKSLPADPVSIALTVFRPKKGGSKSVLLSKKSMKLEVSGNSRAKNKEVSFSLKAGRKDCGVVSTFNLNESSAYTKTMRAPTVSKKLKLHFNLLYQGSVKSTVATSIKPASRTQARGTRQSIKKICRAFKRSFSR